MLLQVSPVDGITQIILKMLFQVNITLADVMLYWCSSGDFLLSLLP